KEVKPPAVEDDEADGEGRRAHGEALAQDERDAGGREHGEENERDIRPAAEGLVGLDEALDREIFPRESKLRIVNIRRMIEELRCAREPRNDARDPEEREPSEAARDDLKIAEAVHRDERRAIGLVPEEERRPSVLRRRQIDREGQDRLHHLEYDEDGEGDIGGEEIARPERGGEIRRLGLFALAFGIGRGCRLRLRALLLIFL